MMYEPAAKFELWIKPLFLLTFFYVIAGAGDDSTTRHGNLGLT